MKLIFTLCSIAHFYALKNAPEVLMTAEHNEARRRAYFFALERGGGRLPSYNRQLAEADFCRAAGQVIEQRSATNRPPKTK